MELRDLRYFVHIAELGSFTRASNMLGIAQPSLTRHMQKLEEHLGVPVFTRVNRGVRLTEAGQRLLDSATRILRDVDRTTQDVSACEPCLPARSSLAFRRRSVLFYCRG